MIERWPIVDLGSIFQRSASTKYRSSQVSLNILQIAMRSISSSVSVSFVLS